MTSNSEPGRLCNEELILSEERLAVAFGSWGVTCSSLEYSAWQEYYLFFCLWPLATRHPNNVIYDGGFDNSPNIQRNWRLKALTRPLGGAGN